MSGAPAEGTRSVPSPLDSPVVRLGAVLYWLTIVFQGKPATIELGAFLTMFCAAWAIARKEMRFSAHILYFPLVLYAAVSSLSALAAERRIHLYFEIMLWFKILIFPAVIVFLREVPRLREKVPLAHAVFAAYVSIWGLSEFFLLDRRTLENRIDGPAAHVMTFSGMLLPISVMLLLLWRYERRWWQLGIGLLSTLTLLLTFTRSVWLGWVAAVLVVLAATRIRLLFFAVPVLLLFLSFLPLALFSRFVSTFDTSRSSNLDRIRMIEAGAAMIRDHPLLGVGPGNVKEVYPMYRKQDAPRPRPPHLHNNVVQLWAERGILGLASYALLLSLFLRDCLRARGPEGRKWRDVGVGVAVSLAVAGLFEFNFGDTEVFYVLLNLMALVLTSIEASGTNEPAGVVVAGHPGATAPVIGP